jgi:23S rRNA (cytosine1962-C5)-methyltransferase
VLEMTGFPDYALLDSGGGRKLERFGKIIVDRPEPQALWQPRLAKQEWAKANAVFSASGEDDEKGRWRVDKPVPDTWPVRIQDVRLADAHIDHVTMLCRLQGLWHLGLFPEQLPHWQWMLAQIDAIRERTGEAPRVLNLFGYTGAASLLAAAAGAHVTHVDASKKAIAWGRENQTASKLADKPIRWLLDDAAKFVARDIRRAKTYHLILVDPPKFGRGPEGETWDLFEHLPSFLKSCVSLLDPGSAALALTVYAIRASTLAFGQLAREALANRAGTFETGELVIREQQGSRVVPTSLYTRWVSQ